jgi:hypothetical protein
MSKPMMLIRTLAPCMQTAGDHHAAYLAEAVDIPDLERRMREVEARDGGARPSSTR